jgi:glycosyltransferase involved in cell wall biosynthesis
MQSHITVLMPLRYYHPEYLNKALDSILHQSCPAWRLLVIVDRIHKDHFGRLLSQHLTDDRVRMIISTGKGMARALNSGMKSCTTDFAGILLADDQWSHDAVQILTDNITAFPFVDFFHSSRRFINENDEHIGSIGLSKKNFRIEDFLISSPVRHLLCWRVEKALKIGGIDESLGSYSVDDYDFPWSMAETGTVFHAIPECLYLYRDHRECFRLTTHVPLSVIKRILRKIMKKHHAPPVAITAKIKNAERTYLRQCLYKSYPDKWIKQTLGFDIRQGYRRKYL